ncbi:PIN domain-containing protein [Domibacillus sp. A3M-37]|uniref:type II toxin-antitoxin system VapC family toxin n=1 Tax=Domibacillus sp. A3M-37 TaxID=2962037 RepID=UPI0020B8A82E|nr:PIN domain-containing protein [Domibacillus sp. A3M-37]MCP3763774.1 PIN domain-containing protein [Domibacillus sp. A3M-37]
MTNIRYLIDNNVWAAHEKSYPDVVHFILESIQNDDLLYMNRVIHMELMSFYEVETIPAVRTGREGFVQLVDEMIELDEKIAVLAAEIRRKAKVAGRSAPKGPDAIIAATAKIHNLILVSNNDKDFVWASKNFGFQYFNPVTDQADYQNHCKVFEQQRAQQGNN